MQIKQAEKSAKNKKTQKPTDFWETKKGQQLLKEGKKDDKKDTPTKEKKPAKSSGKGGKKNQKDESEESSDDGAEDSDGAEDQNPADASNAGAPNDDTDARTETTTESKEELARKKKLEALKARAGGKGQKGTKKSTEIPAAAPKKGKKMTTWDDKPARGAALAELNHSKDTGMEAPRQPTFDPSVKVDVDNWGESDNESEDTDEEESEEEVKTGKKKPEGQKKASSGLMSFFKTFTNRQLSQEDLAYVQKVTSSQTSINPNVLW